MNGFRLATDENVESSFNRALERLFPGIDVVRVVDIGLGNSPDPQILEWAAAESRILLTHDVATMKDYAWDRIRQGLPMPGLFIVIATAPIGPAVEELELIIRCSDPTDWGSQVTYIPMS